MQVIVDRLLTVYELQGKGKLVLILHGWGDNTQGLGDLSTAVSKKYKVLSVDLPGFGGSQAPEGIWDLDNYAKFLKALLAKLELDQPYAVIGHSNGGALAIRAISLGQIKPQKLVLLAASGIRTNQKLKRLMLKIIAKTGYMATLWMPERHRQALRKSLYGAAGSDILVAPNLQETFKKTVRQDVQADAGQIDTPTLLIYGTNDTAIPVSDGRQYRQLFKNSRLELIEDAGHFVHLDKPNQVEKLIEDFLL